MAERTTIEPYNRIVDSKHRHIYTAVYNRLHECNLRPAAVTRIGGEILSQRYLAPGETVADMFVRVAAYVSVPSIIYSGYEHGYAVAEDFYNMMASMDFLPNSPVFKGAAMNMNVAACYVIPIDDSRASIFSALADAANIQAFGGGVGFNFSNIREYGAPVSSTGGTASGPVSFIEIFDLAIGKVITQGGTRAGAQMAVLMYNHPDIVRFIESKRNGSLSNFNISVGVTDDFFVKAESGASIDLVSPHSGRKVGSISAAELLDMVARHAHATGDPGLLFMDRIERDNPTPTLGKLSVNPCSEATLLPYESCVLGSINLLNFVDDAAGGFDYKRLERCIRTAVEFLDNIIDVNVYPLEVIERITKSNRKIGLGVMGWADALIRLGIPYGSDESTELASSLMRFIRAASIDASAELATQRGVFPNYDISVYKANRIRNAALNMVAPTGTISTIAGCSSGIEPLFMLAYRRGTLYREGKPTKYSTVINRSLLEYIDKHDLDPLASKLLADDSIDVPSDSLLGRIIAKGSISDTTWLPDKLADVSHIYVTAHDLSYKAHIDMQSAFQKHCDMSISKTINFSSSATVNDIKDAFLYAWKSGVVKGITVYRDGCKDNQVLSSVSTNKEQACSCSTSNNNNNNNNGRPRRLPGNTHKIVTPLGTLYMTVVLNDGKLYEAFLNIGKGGADITAVAEGYGRLLSLMFRHGVSVDEICRQLSGIGGSNSVGLGPNKVRSLPDAVANVLSEYTSNNGHEQPYGNGIHLSGDICPLCGHIMAHVEGCIKCINCEYSKCG